MILDTSFLIDVMNSDEGALRKVDEIEADKREQLIPAMTLQELFIGVGASKIPDEEHGKIEAIIESRPIVDTTEGIARRAGLIDGNLRATGERIDIGDATIGATGLLLDKPVVTGNPTHFRRIDDLGVETY